MTKLYSSFIEAPKKVKIAIDGMLVKVTGPNATLIRDFKDARGIQFKVEGSKIEIYASTKGKKNKALVGTIASHINNMIKGCLGNYSVIQKVVYAHFPITVRVEDKKILIDNFLGERAPRKCTILGEKTTVKIQGDDVIISGPNIEEVCQTAANITTATKIRNKDPRIFQDGIFKYKKLYDDQVIWSLKL